MKNCAGPISVFFAASLLALPISIIDAASLKAPTVSKQLKALATKKHLRGDPIFDAKGHRVDENGVEYVDPSEAKVGGGPVGEEYVTVVPAPKDAMPKPKAEKFAEQFTEPKSQPKIVEAETAMMQSPKTNASAPVKNSSSQDSAVDAAMDLISSLKVASAPAKKATSQAAPSTPGQHAKLDVGFSDFEKTAVDSVAQKLLRSATGTAWSSDMRAQFEKNVTDAMKETMKSIMKPVKTSIAKTWMALPQDSQKDEYVATLKKSFGSVFESSMHTITSHLDMSIKRIETYSNQKKISGEELVKKSETAVEDSLLNDHCYEVDSKHLKNSAKSNSTNSTDGQAAEKKKFCIQSVISALAHRLNDTQSLISMSMRFEAGAMSLAQKQKKEKGKMV